MNKSRLAALLLGGSALVWGLTLWIGLPFLYSRKVQNLVGHDVRTVQELLGAPSRQWTPAGFECDDRFPCAKTNVLGGPVWMYSDGSQAWYLYFDGAAKLARLEAVRSGS